MTPPMYVTVTVEQLRAVNDLMTAAGGQEAILLDLGEGRMRARCYGPEELLFSVLVDETGTVHDLRGEVTWP
jgi:hypothetical protein